MEAKLSRLVIKPTLACTADCPFCSSRRSLHKEVFRQKVLSLDQWKQIIAQGKALGAQFFVISGGEPTLYRYLIELIQEGKNQGLEVTVNTNGFLLKENLVKRMLDAGLNSICVSLHSHIASVHDALKFQKGLWEKATNGIRLISELTKNNPQFSLQTQGIMCRENIKQYVELMKLHHDLGVRIMRVAYLEGDYTKRFLLKEDEICEFKEKEIPRLLEFIKILPKHLQLKAENTIKNLYSEDYASLSEYASGVYNPLKKQCDVPYTQALCLANGDVHPCNIVEYTHHPVVGNLFQNSLTEIWQGDAWNQFRRDYFEACKLCPMLLQPHIVFSEKPVTLQKKIKRLLRPIWKALVPNHHHASGV